MARGTGFAVLSADVATRASGRLRALADRWYPPRRVHVQRSGWLVVVAAVAVGMAAMVSGNNLLFLLLGSMIGLVVLSGGMSEGVLRGLEVRRRVPHGAVAGEPARIVYEVHNRKRWIPSLALEVGEADGEGRAFAGLVAAREVAMVHVVERFARRGVYPLRAVTVATSFPFGFFHKERDLRVAGEVVVWPRTDRAVREVWQGGDRAGQRAGAPGTAGARGEFRSMRDYRPGDDPRDVHWPSSARRAAPVVRQWERSDGHTHWFCLELRGADEGAADAAVEAVAALALRATERGQRFGLVLPEFHLPPGSGRGQLERALDALARVRAAPDTPAPRPPVPATECVLVTSSSTPVAGTWADTLHTGP